jgi:hypothetical protein
MTYVFGNPYALLINDTVTEVVYMHNYDQKTIEETLAKHGYEEIVICSEYGRELYVGQVRYGNRIVYPQPEPDWVLCGRNELWYPPDQSVPRFVVDDEYRWVPETNTWEFCEDCMQMKKDNSEKMFTFSLNRELVNNAN